MYLKAVKVDPKCDWFTEGRSYPVINELKEHISIILDDHGLQSIVFRGNGNHLNDYVEFIEVE